MDFSNGQNNDQDYEKMTLTELRIHYRFVHSPVFKCIVGPDRQEIYIHQTLATKASEFFKIKAKEEWATDDKVDLTDIDKDDFEIFFGWLYTGRLEGRLTKSDEPFSTAILHAYNLGQRLMAPDFKDSLITEVLRRHINRTVGCPFSKLQEIADTGLLPTKLGELAMKIFARRLLDPEENAEKRSRYSTHISHKSQNWDLGDESALVLRAILEEHERPWQPLTYRTSDFCVFHEHEPNKCGARPAGALHWA